MAASAIWYGTPLKNQWGTTASARIDFATDTIKQALTTSSYAFSQDNDDFFNDVTNEVSSANYTAGGAALGGKQLTYTGGTNTVAFDATDSAWTTVTFTTRYGPIYKDTGTASTSALMWLHDWGGDQTVNAANFTVQYNAAGIATIVVS